MRAGQGMRIGNILAAFYAAAIYGFIFLPVVVLVLFSFQDGRFPIPPFQGFSLRWYEELLADRRLTAALVNSVFVALLSSAAAVTLGFLAAYGLARFRLPGAGLQKALLVAPLTVSYLIIGMGLLITFNAIGFPRSLLAAGIGHVVINMPLCFAIVFSQMGEHQANAERAARDLGAREWQVLALVTVPMMWPSLFASFFLSMTFSWDEFIISFLLTRFDVTLPVEIWNMLRSGLNPKTNAAGSLVFGISVVLVLMLELTVLRRRRPA
ncbi:ABC transporter permease [Lutibaculum baratangense]|uniref:Putative permease of ABC transporter n=1 Tax=Lutibaculum baratangense AMV1 TaxID=631454 RepID=V4RHN4_9HYPH|nr:putative permease of ABC transporter [Lutibaculum baratangense AMV1]